MTAGLLRPRRDGASRVTNIELFFDLVYVFAITQLSHHLLARPTVAGALQTALLFAMVWTVWAYTTWVTNWLDPERTPVRLLLLVLALASLIMSAALPEAFGSRGLAVGATYAGMQIGRTAFTAVVLRGHPLSRNFQRILAWCLVSGALAVVGGLTAGHARELWWLGAVVVDATGGMVGFATPGLGRSTTAEWTIEGGHLAERCQAFVLLALGESIVVIGTTFSRLRTIDGAEVGALVAAFVGAAALWWVYFDRSAEGGAEVISSSADPGRLGRSAYHFIHPVMVAGIIVTAAGDELVLDHPTGGATAEATWMVLGGAALFLAGHAAFKLTVWRVVPWTRTVAVAVLALLALASPHVAVLTLACLADLVVLAVGAGDRLIPRATRPPEADDASTSVAELAGDSDGAGGSGL